MKRYTRHPIQDETVQLLNTKESIDECLIFMYGEEVDISTLVLKVEEDGIIFPPRIEGSKETKILFDSYIVKLTGFINSNGNVRIVHYIPEHFHLAYYDVDERHSITQEFRETGLLLFVNLFLHNFGWAIFVSCDINTQTKVYDVRFNKTKFKGFEKSSIERAYKRLDAFIHGNLEKSSTFPDQIDSLSDNHEI